MTQPMLERLARRFEIPFQVIEGGQGKIMAVISETDQASQPTYIFAAPRHVLRTRATSLLTTAMIVESPAGIKYICGDNGPGEHVEGTLWHSFRLFQITGRYTWHRRQKVVDPITNLERDSGYQDMGQVWAAIEQIDREAFDRQIRTSFEQARFISGRPILADDQLDGRTVVRSDVQLGIRVGVLT